MASKSPKTNRSSGVDTPDNVPGPAAATLTRAGRPISPLIYFSLGLMAVSCGLIFFDLGHYPLWSDEADTALFARGVARTGDTSAVFDQNIFADRNGAGLVNLRGRYQPPLPFYFAAPFVGRDGTSSFWPRFPFALCGIASFLLLAYWLWHDQATALEWVVLSLGFATNVSMLLYFRQCRYNALATLLTMGAAYCYLQWNGRRAMLVGLSVLAVLLMMTHYLPYVGFMAAVGADYWVFKRRERRLSLVDWAIVLIPQVLFGILALTIWNSVDKAVTPVIAGRSWLLDKLTLIGWALRDLNTCEFGVGLFMLAAPLLYFLDKNRFLLRAPLGILAYVLVVSLASPQPVAATAAADIRYLTALIPLCIFLTAVVILTLSRRRWAIALPLALIAFGTNALHKPIAPSAWQSTLWEFVSELRIARPTSTQLAIDWIKQNVRPGQSIWVRPDFMTWPLIYHAPQALYAWQLMPPPQGQFKDLPPIHFFSVAPPDYVLEFGRRQEVATMIEAARQKLQLTYEPAGTLNIFWADLTRPELLWHSFRPNDDFQRDLESVHFWRRADLKGKKP